MNDKPPEQQPDNSLHDDEGGKMPSRTVATFKKGWWPGWIWGIPVAAVGVVLWLSLRALSTSGTDITIVFNQAADMSPGDTHVMYRGLKVGSLVDVHLDDSARHVIATFNIDDSVKRWLNTGTQFYLVGAHPSLTNLASLKTIISGPNIIMVPGEGKAARRFIGAPGPAPEPFESQFRYHLHFKGAVGKLSIGAPVSLRGFTVGDVVSVSLHVDPDSGRIDTPVTIALDPSRFHLGALTPAKTGTEAPKEDASPVLDQVLRHMVNSGLRATLVQSPPIIGGRQVVLKIFSDPPPAKWVTESDGRPALPTATPSGGPGELIAKLDALPIDTIAENVLNITNSVHQSAQRVNELLNSPQLGSAIQHLNSTLAELDKTIHQAGPQIAPTIRSLRETARQIDATAQSARKLTSRAASPNGNVQQALDELGKTARAVRSLANYLERHPNALLTGR